MVWEWGGGNIVILVITYSDSVAGTPERKKGKGGRQFLKGTL